MKVSEELFECSKDIWEKIVAHPFVQGIADGSLPVEKFKYYTIQDNLYLIDYAKVFALGVVKSKKIEDLRTFLGFMHGALVSETDVHNKFLESIGITKQIMDEAKMSIVTESYNKYMLAVAYDGGAAEAAAAVLTCNWSYQFIAERIKDVKGYENSHYCLDWVNIYTSEGFCNDVKANIELVDRLTKDYTREQIENLKTIVKNCSEYEYMFWDIAWKEGKSFC